MPPVKSYAAYVSVHIVGSFGVPLPRLSQGGSTCKATKGWQPPPGAPKRSDARPPFSSSHHHMPRNGARSIPHTSQRFSPSSTTQSHPLAIEPPNRRRLPPLPDCSRHPSSRSHDGRTESESAVPKPGILWHAGPTQQTLSLGGPTEERKQYVVCRTTRARYDSLKLLVQSH